MELPLEGVKVVELTIAVAGPSAGATLADYGADVIKGLRSSIPASAAPFPALPFRCAAPFPALPFLLRR